MFPHLPDLPGWLALVAALLTPGGVVALLLNKRINRQRDRAEAAKTAAETAAADAQAALTTFDLYRDEINALKTMCRELKATNARLATAQKAQRTALLLTQQRLREVEAQCARLQAHLDAYEAAVRQEPDEGAAILARVEAALAAPAPRRRRKAPAAGGAP